LCQEDLVEDFIPTEHCQISKNTHLVEVPGLSERQHKEGE